MFLNQFLADRTVRTMISTCHLPDSGLTSKAEEKSFKVSRFKNIPQSIYRAR